MTGRMDMAVLYGFHTLPGLEYHALVDEALYLVGLPAVVGDADEVALADLYELDLLLPRGYNVVRKLVDAAFLQAQRTPRVVAEIESLSTLSGALVAGLGSTILPSSTAHALAAAQPLALRRIVRPAIHAPLALCTSSYLPLSAPAQAVKSIMLELVAAWPRGAGGTSPVPDPGQS